ncbi:MAG: hypothetical protein WBA63_08685 [Thermomicrobiales bacterium]
MALTITITDPTIIKLIEARAEAGGLTVEQTVERAFKDDTSPGMTNHDLPSDDDVDAGHEDLWALVRDMQARMDPSMSRDDYDNLLFDEHGLPR